LHEALGEVQAQPRLSREEEDKASLSVDGVAYAASTRGAQSALSREAELGAQYKVRCEASLASPNQRALVSSTNSAPSSEVKGVPPSADNVAYAALAPKGTNKVLSRKARTKALCSANHLRRNAKIKAPLCAKSEATTASLPALSSVKLALGGRTKRLASSSEANATDGVVLTSPAIKKRSFTRAPQFE